jgi:hypothetical protein
VRCIVSDTGPLLHLSEAQVLHVLRLMGELYVPWSIETDGAVFGIRSETNAKAVIQENRNV